VNVAVHAQGATVRLTAHRVGDDGDMVEVAVSDDGPGLFEEELVLACERGWRSARSAGRPGSGLGLAQVHELVTAEGGEVVLENTSPAVGATERGLTVRLRVPVRQGA
jgi:signal transduction histidine kinase